MTQQIQCVGKVVKGQIRIVTKPGVMSISPVSFVEETMVSRVVEPHEVPREIRKYAMKGEVQPLVRELEKAGHIGVLDFMKNEDKPWKQQPNQEAKVYQFPIKGGDVEEKSVPEQMVDELIDAGKDIVNPFLNYFFGRRL